MKKIRKLTSLLLVLVLSLALAVPAFAAARESSREYTTEAFVFDDKYNVHSSLYVGINTGSCRSCVWVQSRNNSSIPSDVSATANLYDRNGSVLAYKTSSGGSRDPFIYPTTNERGGSAPYASGGFVYSGRLYTPVEGRTVDGGYAYFASRMRSTLTENNSYPVNSHGETYGSAAVAEYVGDVPTLVSAVGLDNVNGYIRFADMQTESVEGTMIPLYDQEGNVIGCFEV